MSARTFSLAARCPKCRHRPTDRYPASAVEAARRMPLKEEYRNIRCKCGQVYRIAWIALADAIPLNNQKPGPNLPWAA